MGLEVCSWYLRHDFVLWIGIHFRYLGPVPHDALYYAKCMLGGVLACGFTHAGITPLDVTKCNMQVRSSGRLLEFFLFADYYLVGESWKVQWIG